jgi:phage-related holin
MLGNNVFNPMFNLFILFVGNWFTRLLKTFDWHSMADFGQSLAPSHRYYITSPLLIVSASWVAIDKVFGIDAAAFIALFIVFVFELLSGIYAARIRREALSSMKLSRFTLKLACYLVLISVTYLMANSFKNHGKDVPAWAFDWLHVFLVGHIVLENVVSILENVATISGKEKDAIVTRLQDKFYSLLKL